MKKIALLLLIAISNVHAMDISDTEAIQKLSNVPLGPMRHSNYDNEDDDNDIPPRKRTNWTATKKCIIALLLVNTVGLGTDIASLKISHALTEEISPITAYPFKPGIGFPFSPQVGPARNPNCTYTEFAGSQWPTIDFPGAKGECPPANGTCLCTVEECPPAQSYKQYWNTLFVTQVTSIVARMASLLGIGLGTWMYNPA